MDTRIVRSLVAACIAGTAFLFPLGAPAALAETHVEGVVPGDAVWGTEGSPYIVDADVIVPQGGALTIGPGVTVEADPDDPSAPQPAIRVMGGRLDVAGSARSRTAVVGVAVNVSGGPEHTGSASIADADLSGGASLFFDGASGIVATTSVTGATVAIGMRDSAVSVVGSRIVGNQTGFAVMPHQVFVVMADEGKSPSPFMKGAIAQAAYAASSSLAIRGSSIYGQSGPSVDDRDAFTVDAAGDWWGSPSGPALSGANAVRGAVAYAPWLAAEPPFAVVPEDDAPCCSSVLFIPGIEGTRLYRDERSATRRFFGAATTTNRLWEPNNNADLAKLFLGPGGKTVDPTIYSGGPIDSALGFRDVYGGFMRFLDGLVADGTIGAWRPFGYDWRRPIADVVAGPEKKATTTESLVDVVASMASSSKTGKVTVVAHSNGGLVATQLVKTLAGMGKASLVDAVISVAVPFLGTPMAIPALLYGDGQSIAWGLIATQANAQKLAESIPSSYSLLPSAAYFSVTPVPTIAGPTTTAYTAAVQDSFLSPSVDRVLLAAAEAFHAALDPFLWPASIARWAIVGWGASTADGVAYSADGSHRISSGTYGDGTVIAPSAAYGADGGEIAADLAVLSTGEKKAIDHSTILEASSTQAAVRDIIGTPSSGAGPSCSGNPARCDAGLIEKLDAIPGLSVGEKDWASLILAEKASHKELYVRVHSPVALSVYDGSGRHTGEIPAPAVTDEPIEPGLYKFFEADIPGSSFTTDEGDDYISLPDDGQTYTVSVSGTGSGTFGLEIGRIRATTTVEKVEWAGVPVTPRSLATTTVTSDPSFQASVGSLASSTSALFLDENGDGTADSASEPGKYRPVRPDRARGWGIMMRLLHRAGHAILMPEAKDRRRPSLRGAE
ncbi:MAG: hypothetical protein KGI69_03840 [Patescibacteria group bacterium]|nr:hypothetical protein [Patescibacteria group bacterium]